MIERSPTFSEAYGHTVGTGESERKAAPQLVLGGVWRPGGRYLEEK